MRQKHCGTLLLQAVQPTCQPALEHDSSHQKTRRRSKDVVSYRVDHRRVAEGFIAGRPAGGVDSATSSAGPTYIIASEHGSVHVLCWPGNM
jgi:hypothetical protein